MMNDPVREFLLNTGCAEHVVNGGLAGLVENWEKIVASVEKGYELGLDDYLNDLDVRQLLDVTLKVTPQLERAKLQARIEAADAKLKAATALSNECLWGEEVAAEEHWSQAANWWYYSIPNKAGADLREELGLDS